MGSCFSKSKVDNTPSSTFQQNTTQQSKPQKTDKPNEALKDDGTVPNVLQRPYGDILKKYEVQRVLGYGQFGTTRLVKEYETGKNWAVKTIPKRKLKNKLDQEDVLREVQIMEHLKGYPNVVYLKETFEDRNYVHMIMECCSGGELFDRIVQRGQYTERTAADIITVILGIVQHCHRLGVMHRDLKPENFLLTSKGDDGVLKATDFGLSVFYRGTEKLNELVGSPYYVAPEVLRRRYDLKADIWSCGVMLYVLLSGIPPFWGENENEIFDAIQKAPLDLSSEPWPNISQDAKDCVSAMLQRDISKRPNIDEVLNMPFIKNGPNAPDRNLNDVITGRLKNFQGQNKLKRQAFRLISENLAANQIAGLKEWFKSLDKNGDGQITVQEFQASLKQKGFENISEDELRAIVNAADIDKDGNINYNEFIAATLNTRMAITEENVRQVFEKLDKDGSGFLDADELKEAIQDYQGDFKQDIKEIMREADKNGDGKIDYGEFLDMMLQQTQGDEEFAPAQKNKIRW